MAEGYKARLPSTFVPQRAPSGMGTGQAIVRGIAGLAGTVREQDQRDGQQEIQLQEKEARRQRSRAAVEQLDRLTNFQLELETEIEERRKAAPPGASGHAEATEQFIRERMQDFEDELPADEQLRERFLPQIDRMMAGAVSGERRWAAERQAAYTKETVDTWLSARGNALLSKPTGAGFTAMVEDFKEFVGLLDVDETMGAALIKAATVKAATSTIDGLILGGNLTGAKQVLESGELDAVLGDAKKGYLQRIEVGLRQKDTEDKAAGLERKRAAEDALKVLELRIQREDVPQSEIIAAQQEAAAAGVDESVRLKHAYLAEDAAWSSAARGKTTGQLDVRAGQLRMTRSEGKLSKEEERELAVIDKELKARAEEDGASIRELSNSGPNGRIEAIRRLAAMDPDRRERTSFYIGDRQLGVLAVSPPELHGLAVKGYELRKARPDDFKPEDTARANADEQIDAIMRDEFGDVVTSAGGDYDVLKQTALDLMAASGGKWDGGNFRASLQRLAGRTRREDGKWQGGIGTVRGRKVELPPKWTGPEFEKALLSRIDFSVTQYADGRDAVKADVLRHYSIVFDGQNDAGRYLYHFADPTGAVLMRKGGGAFQIAANEAP